MEKDISNAQSLLINNQLTFYKPNSIKYEQVAGTYKVMEEQSGTDINAVSYFVPGSRLAVMSISLLLSEEGQKNSLRLLLDNNGITSVTVTNAVNVYILNPGALTTPLSYEFTDEGTISFGLTGKLEIQRKLI